MNNATIQAVPKLGFGLMRLPLLAGKEVDFSQLAKMVDRFMRSGFTYFDTAFGYMGGRSEEIARRALVDRYPRDSFLLATKLPPWELKGKEDMRRIFLTQLNRTNAGYFDYYLLHSVNRGNVEKLDQFDAWAFLSEKKAKGLARHIGFSFHDTAEVLDKLLAKHPEIEFVQLQINYADWEDAKIQSRLCYETARRHGKAVIIMEPVKGGVLAALTDEARAVLEAVRPGDTPAAWALRYAASLEGVLTVLSGMSTLEQMEENTVTLSPFTLLGEAEYAALSRVVSIFRKTETTPCTDCKYCTEHCPANIPIPAIIAADNGHRIYGSVNKQHYQAITEGKGKASDCIACGVCEGRCPQHIGIISLLRACAAIYE